MALLNKKEEVLKLDRAGRLDRRITVIERSITDGDSNEDYTTAWVEIENYPDVWARKYDLRGKEVVIADKVQFMYLTVWTIRYRTDLKASMRIVDESGQVYEIVTISEGEGRRAWLDIVTNILENETWS
jgi:SPP1 family predicted phage head-tail adaptor